MGLKDCRIYFDNGHGTYYEGQTVTGRVELTLDSVKKVRAINIQFKGEGRCSWTRTENKGDNKTETIHLEGGEEYFKTNYPLVRPQGDSIEIPIGKHVYQFTCALPPVLPSSFEGQYGYVRYTVKVTLDRPWKFDQDSKVAFSVLAPLDLNLVPRLKQRAQLTVEKFFCCCFCKSGPLTCVLTVPCTGYVPGQSINIICEIDNVANVAVDTIRFKLLKKVSYHSQTPRKETKDEEVKILELSCPGVEERSSKTFNQQLVIPSLPPSNLINCNFIDLSYELEVVAIVSGFHQNLDSKIPLTIGTIPFHTPPEEMLNTSATVGSIAISMSPTTQPNAAGIGWAGGYGQGTVSGMPPYPEQPPPSYEQCQFGTKTIQDSSDNAYTIFNSTGFTPMYPVYPPSAPPMTDH